MSLSLASGVCRYGAKQPERLALCADGRRLTYGELARLARKIAAALRESGVQPGGRVGILASRSIDACAGVLGASWAGATYVPISLKSPEKRLLHVLDLSGVSALLADSTGAKLLSERVLAAGPRLILVPDADTARALSLRIDKQIRAVSTLADTDELAEPVPVRAEDLAYVMFTSGTTGVPKGVMVSVGSVHHFLTVMQERYGLTPEDRVGEPMELSFDLSVFNMFMAWKTGASLHVVPSTHVMAPGKFIRENGVTVWLSVPSVIAMMKRVKALKPGSLPSLRYSLFCGEPLPAAAVQSWREAAPNSVIDNLYGPTEATVACLHERVTEDPLITPEREVISIGEPLDGMEACIVDFDLHVLEPGQAGELAVAGPQLATGYLGAPELSTARFPMIAGKRWYLTGDLAYADAAGKFHHLGRIDNQVKVLGYRVELEEIEAHLRHVAETELVAAVAWPVSHGTAEGIVGFVAGRQIVPGEIRDALKQRVPSYMVPASIRAIDSLPLTANGKVDRKALGALLDGDRPPT
ncbi:MAG: amino acid adenylation domain-containing protein [Gemmatimonadales bacterium]